ncbi:hypothetical protein ACG873_21880 [Mesorhizobium sp. AaZ16]|uniref:hypothetical protein n=1 Tax=Mesorhizobium sp. AaZ16 TaxID=3402289 RepID=UPI00374E83FA
MNRPAPFRQADLSRALKAWRSAGLELGRVEIEPSGKIVMTPRRGESDPVNGYPNEWDDTLQ